VEALVLGDALPVLAAWSRPEGAECTETDESAVIYSRAVCGDPKAAAREGKTSAHESVTVLLTLRDELRTTDDGAVVRREPARLIVKSRAGTCGRKRRRAGVHAA